MQVERGPTSGNTGEDLVANGCVTREEPAPKTWDNSWKRLLIPDAVAPIAWLGEERIPVREGLAAYQLVGGVTAYQGIDG